jgi:hypothetical protein
MMESIIVALLGLYVNYILQVHDVVDLMDSCGEGPSTTMLYPQQSAHIHYSTSDVIVLQNVLGHWDVTVARQLIIFAALAKSR